MAKNRNLQLVADAVRAVIYGAIERRRHTQEWLGVGYQSGYSSPDAMNITVDFPNLDRVVVSVTYVGKVSPDKSISVPAEVKTTD